jgi:hypothetical protein
LGGVSDHDDGDVSVGPGAGGARANRSGPDLIDEKAAGAGEQGRLDPPVTIPLGSKGHEEGPRNQQPGVDTDTGKGPGGRGIRDVAGCLA